MQKNIMKVEHPTSSHMVGDGFRVVQYIPGHGREMSNETSPFLMLDYNTPWDITPQVRWYRPWVWFHPHRGFETVTIVYSGEVEHQDTAGHGGIIGADEIQWMTAGSGLLHNEFMSSEFSRLGGTQHMIQLWINLPREYKMTTPRYQALTRENIPEVAFDGGRVRVIAGEVSIQDSKWKIQKKWIAETFSPVELYDVRFDICHPAGIPLDPALWVINDKDLISEGKRDSSVALGMTKETKTLEFQIPENYTTMVLVTEWEIMINDRKLGNGDIAHFGASWSTLSLSSISVAKILIMAGCPLDEPIAHYGPFVMNTEVEIRQAFADLNAGKMGSLDL